MIFMTGEEITVAVRKLHLDIADINAVMTLTRHFMITEGFYLLANKSGIQRRLAGEIKQFLGQEKNMKLAK